MEYWCKTHNVIQEWQQTTLYGDIRGHKHLSFSPNLNNGHVPFLSVFMLVVLFFFTLILYVISSSIKIKLVEQK